MKPGKNWTPFTRGDDLYFIHQFSPFVVLKARFLNEADNFLVLDVASKHNLRTPKSVDRFSQFRGGSAGLEFGEYIVGLGHTNIAPSRWDKKSIIHRPFWFVYRPDHSVSLFEFDFNFEDTYKIVDPTSLYVENNQLVATTCETERGWHMTPQKGRICRYTIALPGEFNENSLSFGGRRLYRWSDGETAQKRRLLGTWRGHKET